MSDERPLRGRMQGYNLDFIDWQNEWERIAHDSPELLYLGDDSSEPDDDSWKSRLKALKKMKMGSSGQVCSICVTAFASGDKIYRLGCCHIFHCECFEPWVKKQDSCPNCRSKLGGKSD